MFPLNALRLALLGICPLFAILPAQQDSTVFHAGSHLVEVQVVVRDKNSPVTGLTQSDFTLLDQDKPQRIASFHEISDTGSAPRTLPPGAVSNRTDNRGQALDGATVILLDQLNTRFDLKGYERTQMIKLLRSLAATDRIALYVLGKNLHILQDFTDDPRKLIETVARMDQGLDLLPTDFDDLVQETSDGPPDDSSKRMASVESRVYADIHDHITIQALSRIMLHLSGVPGRRNLVWLKEQPLIPPQVMGMAQQANVNLYPVLVRTVLFSIPDIFLLQHMVDDVGRATGGAGFADAGDLATAVRTAEEDSRSAYVLAYYPPEETLDGRFHRIAVKLADRNLQLRYRPGYLATKTAVPVPLQPDEDLFANPLDLTGIGLTAQLRPDPSHPERSQAHVTVDLHDIHLEPRNGRLSGAFKLSLLVPASHSVRSWTFPVDLAESQLASALETGYAVNASGLERHAADLRVVVRDLATGLTGSLRIPAAK